MAASSRKRFAGFAAALAGYVEATRDEDELKNRLWAPSPYPNTPQDWARMQVLGARAAMAFGPEPDIKEWANRTTLNPAASHPSGLAAPVSPSELGAKRPLGRA